MADDGRYEALREQLIRKAALTDSYEPKALLNDLIGESGEIDRASQVRLLSALRQMSTTETGPSGESWLLRPTARQKALEKLEPETVPVEPDRPITQALAGAGQFAPGALAEMLDGPVSADRLLEIVVTLERAGPAAPGHKMLLPLRSRLNRLRQAERTDALLGDEFIGRSHELGRIEQWLDRPQTEPPLKTLHVEGLPGIGKSYLIEQVMRMVRDRPETVLVRLDFDRTALQVGENATLFDEISRQMADALPEAALRLRKLRLEYAERLGSTAASSAEMPLPHEMLDAMVDILSGGSLRLLFLLDTLEKLQGQGATFVERVMHDLGRFLESGRVPVSVISAGRGPIFPEGHPRLQERLLLAHLEADICERILEKRGVPEARRKLIIEYSRGNPLRLTLFAHAMQDADLPFEALLSVVDTGHLYRMIGSRVPEETRAIAHLGLILPMLDADILMEVVAPVLDLSLSPEQATRRIETLLEQQDWLVQRNADGTISHRPEVRREILPMLYEDDPDTAEDLNRRAAAYFEGNRPTLQLYHEAQLTRFGDPFPDIGPLIAQRLPEVLLAELPEGVRGAILNARGQRSMTGAAPEEDVGSADPPPRVVRAGQRKGEEEAPVWIQANPNSPTRRLVLVEAPEMHDPPDRLAMRDLRVMLEKGERREASHIVREARLPPLDPASEEGLLLLAHQWRTGRWSAAGQVLGLLPADALDRWISEDPALIGRVLLELWAEFRFDRLVRRLRDESFGALVLTAVRASSRTALRGGALDFALMAAGIGGLEKYFPDPVRGPGVLAPFIEGGLSDSAMTLRRDAEALRADLGVSFLPPDSMPAELPAARSATAIAPINPYAEPIRAFVAEAQAAETGEILGDLGQFRDRLPEAAMLHAPGVSGMDIARQRLSDWPEDVIDAVRTTGLIADWAEGYSFFHPIADLPAMAHAAERWRLVSAGVWKFGRIRPQGWTVDFTADPQTEDRARHLMDAPDAERLCLRALTIWAGEREAGPHRMLRHRLAKRYRRVLADLTLRERLAVLQSSGLAGALAAPLAVLAERGVPEEQVFAEQPLTT